MHGIRSISRSVRAALMKQIKIGFLKACFSFQHIAVHMSSMVNVCKCHLHVDIDCCLGKHVQDRSVPGALLLCMTCCSGSLPFIRAGCYDSVGGVRLQDWVKGERR